MKLFVCLLLSFGFLQVNGQANFQDQFVSLIKDVEVGLVNSRGTFKRLASSDSIFYSAIILEGTINNEILVAGNKFHYTADVADSLDEKQGRKSADDLKSRISVMLNTKYKISQLKIESWNPAIYGWRFKHNGITVSITLYRSGSVKSHFMVLGIDNFDVTD
ncbi:MAG: hypothetical protein JNK27_16565 [Chitinophagaceae bacterium]|nr:hypothetical protein [Chitinophagaceae bacterium]